MYGIASILPQILEAAGLFPADGISCPSVLIRATADHLDEDSNCPLRCNEIIKLVFTPIRDLPLKPLEQAAVFDSSAASLP